MKKYILILLLLILLSSCTGEKWNGIYCNDDNECKQFAGFIGHEFDLCPEILEFNYPTAEQYVAFRDVYYLQSGTCSD